MALTGLGITALAGCGSSPAGPPAGDAASSRQMVQLLETLLPDGEKSARQGQGVTANGGPSPFAELVFGRGGQSARVQVVLNWNPVPVPAMLSECPDSAYHPYSRCTKTALPAGASLVRDESPMDQKDPSGAKQLTVRLTAKDGKQVFVTAADATRTPAADRAGSFPLTLEQLAAVATSLTWRPVLAAMPEPPSGALDDRHSPMTGPQISRLLQELLPNRLDAGQEGGSDGFGHVVVDDGKGGSLLAANVQRWKPDDPDMAALFEKAETLPDGTRVSVRKGLPEKGGKGTVEWTADVFRDNGFRVVVSALNSPAYPLSATRPDPALTTAELKEIALSPLWQKSASR
ncbi:hypothetical protein ACWCPM_31755 [Streptomyces sp. NPDC002309]